jgi:hypothetical protein
MLNHGTKTINLATLHVLYIEQRPSGSTLVPCFHCSQQIVVYFAGNYKSEKFVDYFLHHHLPTLSRVIHLKVMVSCLNMCSMQNGQEGWCMYWEKWRTLPHVYCSVKILQDALYWAQFQMDHSVFHEILVPRLHYFPHSSYTANFFFFWFNNSDY